MASPSSTPLGAPARAGRYTLHGEIASGGMATVHYGQMIGAHGFSRVVAIKRMLPRLARDARFHAMFVDEARLASRVQHPNVVPILDVVDEDGELMIVMEYVRGPPLSALLESLLQRGQRLPVPIAASIGCGMLAGLHAAHEARDRRGQSLGIVHRDVSPQNVLVGIDGVARIMDFGVAKATELAPADDGTLTGKLAYMAPEQLDGSGVDRRTDVFAAGVVLWSALAGRRLFRPETVAEARQAVSSGQIPPLATARDDVPPALEQSIAQALHPERERRPQTAEAFAAAIEAATALASPRAVGECVQQLFAAMVGERDAVIVQIEKTRTAMALSAGGAIDESEPVHSDVLTNEWIRERASSSEAAPPAAAETRRSPKAGYLALGSILALSLVATAAWWATTAGNEAEPLPAASVPAELELAKPQPKLEPKPEREPEPDPQPVASPAPSASVAEPVRKTKTRVTTAKPRPPATAAGRGDYYPDRP